MTNNSITEVDIEITRDEIDNILTIFGFTNDDIIHIINDNINSNEISKDDSPHASNDKPKCPCSGCHLNRDDPSPFIDDRPRRRKELKKRSDIHNTYRKSVGIGTSDDPGPMTYRPNRAFRRNTRTFSPY